MKWDLAIAAITVTSAILLVASVAFAVDGGAGSPWEFETVSLNVGSLNR